MKLWLAFSVALLGGLGSLCRWSLSMAIQRRMARALVQEVRFPSAVGGARGDETAWLALGASLPVWTFAVNALGSLAIGAVLGFFMARPGAAPGVSPPTAVALTAGFLGGFTTYSSFAFETVRLIEQRSYAAAAVNVLGTVVVCLLACALGLWLGRAVAR